MRISRLEEQIANVLLLIEPFQGQFLQINSQLNVLSIFATNNPKLDLIDEIQKHINNTFKITERLASLETKLSQMSYQYNETISKQTLDIREIKPQLKTLHEQINKSIQDKHHTEQLRQQFIEMKNKFIDSQRAVNILDRHQELFRTQIVNLEETMANKSNLSDILKVQQLVNRDFVQTGQLEELKNNVNVQIKQTFLSSCKIQDLNDLSKKVYNIEAKQEALLNQLVETQFANLVEAKFKQFCTQLDLSNLNQDIHQRQLTFANDIEQLKKAQMQKNSKFYEDIIYIQEVQQKAEQQINLINQSMQKIVFRDEYQAAIQKTLRLQRESEFLNEKIEGLQSQMLESQQVVVGLKKFVKEEQKQITQMQVVLQDQQYLSQKTISVDRSSSNQKSSLIEPIALKNPQSMNQSIMLRKISSNSEIEEAELQDQIQAQAIKSPSRSLSPKRRKSIFNSKSKSININTPINQSPQLKASSDIYDQMVQLINKFDLKINSIQEQVDQLRNIEQVRSKLNRPTKVETNNYNSHDGIILRQLQKQQDTISDQVETLQTQIRSIQQYLQNIEQHIDVRLQPLSSNLFLRLNARLKELSTYEFNLSQKCNNSDVIVMIDQKANQNDLIALQQQYESLEYKSKELINMISRQTEQNSKQTTAQIIQKISQTQNPCESLETNMTCENLKPKLSNRDKSYSSYSGRKMKMENLKCPGSVDRTNNLYNQLKSSPIAFKIANLTKQTTNIIKQM